MKNLFKSVLLILFVLSLKPGYGALIIDTRTPLTKEQVKINQEILKARGEAELKLLKLKEQMDDIILKNEKLKAELKILSAEHKKAILGLTTRLKKLSLGNKLNKEKMQKELLKTINTRQKLEAELKLALIKKDKDLEKLKLRREELTIKNSLKKVEKEAQVMDLQYKTKKLALTIDSLKKQMIKSNLKNKEIMDRLKSDMEIYSLRKEWQSKVLRKINPPVNPYKNRVLTVSHRRISLNGPIISGTADYVCERIHYYNNKSSRLPIFIMIDYCPGGSVMEGARILKAMESSKAPIHVVVKSMAASMAAIIVSRAKNSYAYPNAIILHHQPSTINMGNITETRETLETLRKWGRRILKPVADKMGISIDKFYKEMYKQKSTGDWFEFADRAKKLKWVNNIITGIKEESYLEEPGSKSRQSKWFFYQGYEKYNQVSGKSEKKGKVKLPGLQPFDFYFLYDPHKQFYWN